MTFLNCTINPFIYLLKYKDYQLAVKDLLVFRAGKRNSQPQNVSTTQLTTVSNTQEVHTTTSDANK